jgi:N-terminal domain of toast_rack, DUF2154
MNLTSRYLPVLSSCLAVAVLFTQGCNIDTTPAGPAVTETKNIELGKAELVNVEVRLGVGELDVSGGTSKLLEGEFVHSENLSRPEVRYDETGFRGRLVIETEKENRRFGGKGQKNRWSLRFNETVPLDFNIKLGVGESKLDFSRLKPRSIEINSGVGTTDIDLRGSYEKDFEVRVHGGVGEAKVRLPKDVAVTIDAKGGIGGLETRNLRRDGDRWVNEAFGKAKATIHLEVRGGVGHIEVIG